MNISTKTKAIGSAIATAAFGFVNWLATVPPEQQSGILATLVEITPIHWRPTVGLWTRMFMTVSAI